MEDMRRRALVQDGKYAQRVIEVIDMGFEENILEVPGKSGVNALYLTGMDGKKTYLPEFPSMDLSQVCEKFMMSGYANLRDYGPSYSKAELSTKYLEDKQRAKNIEDYFIK